MKRNAIIMAAGTSSRFVPLSLEIPKGLIPVKGEVLIERQIRQLKEAGIDDITLVVGYMAQLFSYLVPKYGVSLVLNEDYSHYNNTSSLIRVIDKLDNTFICSSDNYFEHNVFIEEADCSYYSSLFAEGPTKEYCLALDDEDMITDVTIGGHDSWYMVGHVFLNHVFSEAFREIMIQEYKNDLTRTQYWEDVYIRHIKELPLMKINRYHDGVIHEFDSIDELRLFDSKYVNNTGSSILQKISRDLGIGENHLHAFGNLKRDGDFFSFSFKVDRADYLYSSTKGLQLLKV